MVRITRFSLHDIDLRSVRVFVSVCNSQGVTAAQADLNMAVSTISSYVSSLEQRLGFKLCHRGRAGFRLTVEGEQVYEAAMELLKAIGQFESIASTTRGGLNGTLRIGALDTAIHNPKSPLIHALRLFNARATNVRFELQIHSSSTCEKQLLAGDLDLAFVCLPRKVEGITYKFLFNEDQQLFCGDKHPFFRRDDKTITAHDLGEQKFVSRDMWLQIESSHFVAERADALINHIDAKSLMIRTGFYLGFMPVVYAQPLVEAGALRSIGPEQFSWVAPYYLITRNGSRMSRALAAFLEDIDTAFGAPLV
jgi:DNA-binding transcriptional LysR family regulator